MTVARAPGKVILFGEHAVVYGRPAIAVPVTEVQATVTVEEKSTPGVIVHALDIGQTVDVLRASPREPLSLTVRNALRHLGLTPQQVSLSMTIRSSIPVASGLGSGAAVSTAMVRALFAHLGHPVEATVVSAIVYETEKIYHGTPSGIDNTVIAHERPVYFCRGRPMTTFAVRRPFWLAIADTGRPSLTGEAVADVRAAWRRDRAEYERIFDQIGRVVEQARAAIVSGEVSSLGPLMSENQRLLRRLRVSSPELENLIVAAHDAGAMGAKLSGGGRGGNMIALIASGDADRVRQALLAAGARRVIVTRVG